MPVTLRLLAVLAAVFAAGGARAQTLPNPNTPPGVPPARRPPTTTPQTQAPPPTATPSTTTPPSTTAPPAGGGAAGTAKPLTEDMKRMINDLHARNHGQVAAAQLAMQKAQSPDVKNLASKLNNDRTVISVQLDQLARGRGMPSLATPSDEAKRQSQEVTTKMSGMQGADFDRAYVAEVIRDTEQDEASIKKLRDAAPGKDPELKGTLDNLENVIEGDLAAARQAKVKLDQGKASARRPPG